MEEGTGGDVLPNRELGVGEWCFDEMSHLSPHLTGAVTRGAKPRMVAFSGAGSQHPEQETHQGRLAGAVETDDGVDLSGVDFEIDIVDGHLVPNERPSFLAISAVMRPPRQGQNFQRATYPLSERVAVVVLRPVEQSRGQRTEDGPGGHLRLKWGDTRAGQGVDDDLLGPPVVLPNLGPQRGV